MAKLIDPRFPKASYRTPIERYGCPLETDAVRKRGPLRQIQEYSILAEPIYSCPAPNRDSGICLFSATVSEAGQGSRLRRRLTLTEMPGLNICLERTEYSANLYIAEESAAREVNLNDGTLFLRTTPSLALQLAELDPPDREVYLVGKSASLVRSVNPSDIRDYGLDPMAFFMFGKRGLFHPGEFTSLNITWF